MQTYGKDIKISIYKEVVKEEESYVNKPNEGKVTY